MALYLDLRRFIDANQKAYRYVSLILAFRIYQREFFICA